MGTKNGVKSSLTQERLKELLDYDPDTGIFRWKVNRTAGINAGEIAGCTNKKGYSKIGVDGQRYWLHRLAWLYVYGYIPENDIDHIDHNPKNNSINNLREVSVSCNMKNSRTFSTNKSGIRGVCYNKKKKKITAQININGKTVNLGFFNNIVDAAKARLLAEKKYGYHDCNSTSTARSFIDSLEDF